jgi:hypothetical protein
MRRGLAFAGHREGKAMRIPIAGLLGAIVMFVWQFVAHMALPIGEMGFRQPLNEDVVLQAVATGLPTPGIYFLPSLSPDKMNDKAAVKAWTDKAAKSPFVWAVVNPPTPGLANMTPQLGGQFVTNLLGALLVAFVLSATAWGFGLRVIGALVFGVFGWLLNIVPLWNWYRFPTDYMIGNLLEQGIGWLLAGIAIAWWLGRGRRAIA